MIDQRTFERYAAFPECFRAALIVDCDGQPKRLGDVQDDWQLDDFGEIDGGLEKAVGRSNDPDVKTRVWLERSRGASKTTDLAVLVVWALTFAVRPIKAHAFAADRDQARLLRDAIETLVRLNGWIGEILNVETHRVTNVAAGHPGEGSRLEIYSSDLGSSYGLLSDLIVVDEVTHWGGDDSLWNSIVTTAGKRSNCLLVSICNAGFCDSWQHSVRERVRTDEAWHFSRLETRPSWITEARLAELKRMLPGVAYARLVDNVWSSGGGDALLVEDIEACFDESLQPMTGAERGFQFVAGIDLGVSRDCSSIVVLGIPDGGHGRIRLAHHRLWRPTLGRKVDLTEVESHVLDLDRRFDLAQIGFDPWQMESMAQRLESLSKRRSRSERRRMWAKTWMREIPPTGANLREQATLTVEGFADRRFLFYDCPPLRRDLLKLRCIEKSYGVRLDSPRDEFGHGDSFSAFALALLIGHELAGKRTVTAGVVQPTAGAGAVSIQSRSDHYSQVLRQARH
ncbi:MAG: hypothetical protein GX621_08690, partial [Pirellulaceae bacterium]|nr:hypothetical protein [Pirellulaceae bacterium]